MRLPIRDVVATGLVAVAGLLYGLWTAGLAPWGMSSVRMTGVVVLALGFVASASAVGPGFDRLIRGSRAYLAVTTALGLAALAGGLWMLVASAVTGLDLLIGCTGAMWLVSTVRHSVLAGAERVTPTGTHLAPPERKEAA